MSYQVQYTSDVGCYYENCETFEEAVAYANDVKESAGTVEIYRLTLVQDVK